MYGIEIAEDSVAVDEDPFHDDKIIFVFGNEGDGLSEKAQRACDRFVRIKQFAPKTASLNVSVRPDGRDNKCHSHSLAIP